MPNLSSEVSTGTPLHQLFRTQALLVGSWVLQWSFLVQLAGDSLQQPGACQEAASGSHCGGETSRGQCRLDWGVQTSGVSKTGSWWAPYVSTALSSANSWRPNCEPNTGFQHGQTPEPSKRMPSSGQNTEPNHEWQVLIRAIVEVQQIQ